MLSERELYNEFIMLNLRLSTGIEKENLSQFNDSIRNHFSQVGLRLINEGVLHQDENRVFLNSENWYRSDAISAELFYD